MTKIDPTGRLKRLLPAIQQFLRVGSRDEKFETRLTIAQEALERELGVAKDRAVAAIRLRNALRCKLQEREKEARHQKMAAPDPEIVKLRRMLEEADKKKLALMEAIRVMEFQVTLLAAHRYALLAGWHSARVQQKVNRAVVRLSRAAQSGLLNRVRERLHRAQDDL